MSFYFCGIRYIKAKKKKKKEKERKEGKNEFPFVSFAFIGLHLINAINTFYS